MRFVPIKNVEQQVLLGIQRARQGFVKARIAQANQIRGLLDRQMKELELQIKIWHEWRATTITASNSRKSARCRQRRLASAKPAAVQTHSV